MKSIIESIKNYFAKKNEDKTTEKFPEGACPDCWGRQEWDGHFYEVIKDKHLTGSKIYESFISKVVDEHVTKIHQHGDTYKCTSCGSELS